MPPPFLQTLLKPAASAIAFNALVLGLSGCGGEASSPPPLGLTALVPGSEAAPIALNDDVRVTFDGVLDPMSITMRSVSLVNTATQRPADGHWVPEGRELRFQPRGPLRPDLMDGGFQPGAEYVLHMDGFPLLSGPRSLEGAGLSCSIRHSFRTAASEAGASGPSPSAGSVGTAPPAGPVLLRDASPDAAAILYLRPEDPGAFETTPLAWNADLLLACDEPLDPRWFRPEDFIVRERQTRRFLRSPIPQPEPEQLRSVEVTSISLLRNEDEDVRDASERAAAVLRVTFAENLPLRDGSSGAFELLLKPGAQRGGGVLDFSGHPAWRRPIPFFAARQDAVTPEREGSYEFEFLDAEDSSPLLDPASDGTAFWSNTGRLEVRYPRAAGLGEAGRVDLGATFGADDLHATRLRVPESEETRLTGEGLVVLRAQGRVDIDGRLLRTLEAGAAPEPMWDPRAVDTSASTQTLTEWLAEAKARNAPWTVIVAGGDLVVRGEIKVETPLLLVAGGMIRGVGEPRAARDQVWLLGAGGFESMPYSLDATASPNVAPPLVIDEPKYNQLVEPLSFVAISSEVPKEVAPTEWGAPTILGSSGSAGAFKVQFLRPAALTAGSGPAGARPGTWPGIWAEEWLRQAVRHDAPMDVLLESGQVDERGGRVRLRMELRLLPRTAPRNPGPWDPPFIDRVRLFWTPNPR